MTERPAAVRLVAAELRAQTLEPHLVGQCAALERLAFPNAHAADLLSEEDMLAYARTFPEGFFVILDGTRVVGQGAGIFLDFDFHRPQHTLAEITGEHQCGRHDWSGAWYYGVDIAVHPDYRRLGLGRRLYSLRKELVRCHNKRGILAGGHIPGYASHKDRLSPGEYVDRVVRGELRDPTLSFQLANGFEALGLLENYVRDTGTGGWSVLIRWRNPAYHP